VPCHLVPGSTSERHCRCDHRKTTWPCVFFGIVDSRNYYCYCCCYRYCHCYCHYYYYYYYYYYYCNYYYSSVKKLFAYSIRMSNSYEACRAEMSHVLKHRICIIGHPSSTLSNK
jgi:hypothetical protein